MKAGTVVLTILRFALSVLILVFVVVGIYRLGQTAYDFGYRVFTEPAVAQETNGRDMVVTVSSTMSEKDIAEDLEEKGLIRDALLFQVQLRLSEYHGELQPGAYTLNTSMTAKEMMRIMAGDEAEEETEEA